VCLHRIMESRVTTAQVFRHNHVEKWDVVHPAPGIRASCEELIAAYKTFALHVN
jgi:hypothetical protein